MKSILYHLAGAAMLLSIVTSCKSEEYDVVVVGGGASGCTAGIQAAGMGSRTLIVEELPWLGGMLTSAGVSATDGCYNLPSGLWGEFQRRLASHYGSMDALRTGWVSNIQFEPSVGNEIFNTMCSEQDLLNVWKESRVSDIRHLGDGGWRLMVSRNGRKMSVRAKVLIDATELGDIAAHCGVPYDIGMESREVTGERIAPLEGNGIIQDLTYVAILKDYGRDVSIGRPMDYDSTLYACCCANPLCVNPKEPDRIWPADMMLSYGKLPGGKYMINWPIEGNDFYLNVIEMSPEEREEALKKAKSFTMGFIYFIQHELGYNTLGLADDEFPTGDRLPFIPYHRESRRIHGKVRFTLNHIEKPYDYSLYRTGIAVGDYPVDHHHKRYTGEEELPDLHFFPIPSFTVPLGVMIPENVGNLIVAEKSISVSNIANGTTRLQPVVMQIGQAAGALASMMVSDGQDLSVRKVQKALLEDGCYLQPFIDAKPDSPLFPVIQRIGSTGILRGEGRQIQWTNVTDLHVNELYERKDLRDLYDYYGLEYQDVDGLGTLTVGELVEMLRTFPGYRDDVDWVTALLNVDASLQPEGIEKQPVTRAMFAVLTDCILNPFDYFDVDIYGNCL
ncbi:MAG: FAD-dependent oxidoreductase [Candidatus Cryptobacteroides sp.]